jgi:hypothetical protein
MTTYRDWRLHKTDPKFIQGKRRAESLLWGRQATDLPGHDEQARKNMNSAHESQVLALRQSPVSPALPFATLRNSARYRERYSAAA